MVVEWTPQTVAVAGNRVVPNLAKADRNMKAELVWERKGQAYATRRAMSSRILDLFLRVRYNGRPPASGARAGKRMPQVQRRISWQHSAMARFEFAPDVFSREGFTLLVGGEAQSHVDPSSPTRLFFEYVRRIGNVVDGFRDPGAPVRALHLGGGGLSLPRYVEATRPGSSQVVVEHDRELLDAVLARIPLPRDADVELVVADAREAVARLAAARSAAPSADAAAAASTGFDLVVVDLYTGYDPPAFVASEAFARDVLATLAPDGLAVVNVADAAGLARLRAQARAYARARPETALLVAGSPEVLSGAESGNAILVAAPGGVPARVERRLLEGGPHPADVLTAERVDFVLWGAC